MKIKYNLIGDSFTHLTGGNKGYSTHGKVSKYIEWVYDGSSDETFYIDRHISLVFDDSKSIKKYGWLLESKYITPDIVEDVKRNYLHYVRVFDLIFTHNQELLALHPKFKFVPAQGYWITETKIRQKCKLVSMISSNKTLCQGHLDRLKWVEKLKDKVDLFGRGFNEIALKEEGLENYMFSIAIENGVYETYFTEKILDCFATGTIPVYLGSPDIGNYFDEDGIIILDESFDISQLTSELYCSKIDHVKENLNRVKENEILEDFIFLNYLRR
jgi:hypothetical protein